jgi:hypothetical protein
MACAGDSLRSALGEYVIDRTLCVISLVGNRTKRHGCLILEKIAETFDRIELAARILFSDVVVSIIFLVVEIAKKGRCSIITAKAGAKVLWDRSY